MNTSIEREAQGGVNGHPPLVLQGGRLYHHRRNSDGEGVGARKEGSIPAEAGSTAAAKAPRWEYNREHPRRA